MAPVGRLPDWRFRPRENVPGVRYTRIEVGVSPRLSWYLTENVKVVPVVPDPGETVGSVRLPLSGQLTARADAGNTASATSSDSVTVAAPASLRPCRFSERRGMIGLPVGDSNVEQGCALVSPPVGQHDRYFGRAREQDATPAE